MNQKILTYLFLFFLPLAAAAHPLDDNEQNPALFHNVNVITGSVELAVEDTIVQGARPLKLHRSYSSLRATGKHEQEMLSFLKSLRHGFMIEGGWSFFRHVYLLVYPGRWKEEEMTAYVAGTAGEVIPYEFQYKNSNHDIILKPQTSSCKMYGRVSAREDISNSFLHINDKQATAMLLLPDGTRRHYKGVPFRERNATKTHNVSYYVLEKEEFPSRYKHLYSYDRKDRLVGVKAVNDDETKIFASISFALSNPRTPYLFTALTSDQKKIDYHFKDIKNLDYLSLVEGSGTICQSYDYSKEKNKGSYPLCHISIDSRTRYRFEYYPFTKQKNKNKPLCSEGKVSRVFAPAGDNGADVVVAYLEYEDGKTVVYDCDGAVTEYHHDGFKLHAIEYYNKEKESQGRTNFLFEENRLIAKIRLDKKGAALFSKTFSYDKSGNIIKEVFWGDITGNCSPPFDCKSDGSLDGAESFSKKFVYDPELHLILSEKEENGLEYRYQYVIGTDLIKAKLTYFEDRCLKREFFFYDSDHLLIEEIADDGLEEHPDNLFGVTQRIIKQRELDPISGLVIREKQLGWDVTTNQPLLITLREFLYNAMNLIEEEKIFDSQGLYRFSKYFRYDSLGHIIEEKNPYLADKIFCYDSAGMLISCKEPGSRQVINTYDAMHRLIRKQHIDEDDIETIEYRYDPKGNVTKEQSSFGLVTLQQYDSLSRCKKTYLPPYIDEHGEKYTPCLEFIYDEYGNLSNVKNGQKVSATTTYNGLRLPKSIIDCEGEKTLHTYNLDDTLSQTIHPDGTVEIFSYDPLKRVTAKRIYSLGNDLLSEELWEYSTFHLIKHQAPSGLVTTYQYDHAGRLIATDTAGIKTHYSFDALGYLEKKEEKDIFYITKKDDLGRTWEEWREDRHGWQEQRKRYFFDKQNRKVKIERVTSKGLACDLFLYDSRGRVITHTTPLAELFQYSYGTSTVNTLGQKVLTKTSTDPTGLSTVECFDAQGRLSWRCKYSEAHLPRYREDFSYNRSGHKVFQKITSYDLSAKETISHLQWKYDAHGRLIQEIDAAGKKTEFSYTSRGFLSQKIIPSGQSLYYSYDGLGRITEVKDCQGTVHYRYHYGSAKDPQFFEDCLSGINVERAYDLLGNIIEEKVEGRSTQWCYDSFGRLSQITLADQSSIHYRFNGMHLQEIKRITADGRSYSHEYEQFDLSGHVVYEHLIDGRGAQKSSYDVMERPISIQSPFHHCHYRYNSQGLVSFIDQSFATAKSLQYDCLHQLTQEGHNLHSFDSMGNPSSARVGQDNALLSYKGAILHYDILGRPLEKSTATDKVSYTFDILGRLTSLQKNKDPATFFFYDAVGRLHCKKEQEQKTFFLYDGDIEIGSCDADGNIQELKVLGLGVKEDVGGAVALEIQGRIYLPLHDIKGSIIAIADEEKVTQSYSMDSFGAAAAEETNVCPWRFQSKRHEKDLIFFGGRFYDPLLQRWLTPDPKGYIDGPNLYAFVLNNPANYLDLFGFEGEGFLPSHAVNLEVPMHLIQNNQALDHVHALKGSIDGVAVDWIVKGGDWTRLQFSSQEIEAGRFNLLHHIHEMLPQQERTIGLISFQNGIRTSRSEAVEFVNHIAGYTPPGTLVISLYNPSKNFFSELLESHAEIRRAKETKITALTRQYFTAISTTLFDINPRSLWLHIAHSRAGGIAARAIEGMTEQQQKLLKQNLMYLGIAPSVPLSHKSAYTATNIYSQKDYITGIFGKPWQGHKDYDIHFIQCMTPFSERMKTILFADHAFFGDTYKNVLPETIHYQYKQIESTHEFHR